jgi:hypothetical protein
LILLVIGAAFFVITWPGISGLLKSLFPGKTKWDYLEKILIPVAPPMAIGFGVWYLDKSSKNREKEREEKEAKEKERIRIEENKSQALQAYFDRISALLIEKQVINLAESAKKLSLRYRDPVVESARDVIRAQTLAILRIFSEDVEKKSAAIRFLMESEILASLAVSLSGADLSKVNLSEALLRGADLSRANLSEANLFGANLRGADLRGADLSRTNLSGANLSEAMLFAANLSGANLRGADLSRANLSGANLSEANLSGANLSEAMLFAVNLSRTNLSGANLSEAMLFWVDLGVEWDAQTIWPPLESFVEARHIPEALKKHLGL